jgi:hypothetical protein
MIGPTNASVQSGLDPAWPIMAHVGVAQTEFAKTWKKLSVPHTWFAASCPGAGTTELLAWRKPHDPRVPTAGTQLTPMLQPGPGSILSVETCVCRSPRNRYACRSRLSGMSSARPAVGTSASRARSERARHRYDRANLVTPRDIRRPPLVAWTTSG